MSQKNVEEFLFVKIQFLLVELEKIFNFIRRKNQQGGCNKSFI